jgi:hypothetical protein
LVSECFENTLLFEFKLGIIRFASIRQINKIIDDSISGGALLKKISEASVFRHFRFRLCKINLFQCANILVNRNFVPITLSFDETTRKSKHFQAISLVIKSNSKLVKILIGYNETYCGDNNALTKSILDCLNRIEKLIKEILTKIHIS